MLSKRLLEIAKLVDENKVVFDVGSDHGLLPCFLLTNNICPKAYAGDNKELPLSRAKQSISKYGLEGKVIPVLSDGLQKVEDDVDIVVIAGMGFYTVKHILEGKDLSKYDKLIVQVNKDVNLLRQYISDQHYTILDEIVINDGFYYQVVVFNSQYHDSYSDLEIKYGPCLLKKKSKEFLDYLTNHKKKLENIYKKSNNPKTLQTIKEIEGIIDIIK